VSRESKPEPEITEGAEFAARVGNAITDRIIGAAIEVHRQLGPGLLESAYEECLCYELSQMGLEFKRQVHLPVRYKGVLLDCGHKMDLVVESAIVIEIKAVESLLPIHSAQLLTYLKSSGHQIGLLINFNVPVLERGLKRIVNHYGGPCPNAQSSAPSALEPGNDAQLRSQYPTPRLSPRLRVSAVSSEPAVNPERAVK
jgi:GxxExxY protein